MPLPRTTINIEHLNGRDWWSKVDIKGPDECWPWKQSKGSHGYGQTFDGTTVKLAHRVAWVLHHQQQVPEGMTIDHRPECLRICCNPAHLRVLSNAENATNNGQGWKTHCPRGHPYKGDNLYIDRRGHRRCRSCAKERRFRTGRLRSTQRLTWEGAPT